MEGLSNNLFRREGDNMSSRVGIFIHVPKTGGSYLSRCFKVKGIRVRNVKHTPIRFVRNTEGLFTFCLVRNPYERFLSACVFNGVDHPNKIESLSEEMMKGGAVDYISKFSLYHYEHFFTQKHFVTDAEEKICMVDYVGRYEDMDGFLSVLVSRGIHVSDVFVLKEGRSSNWEEVLTERTKVNIADIYHDDFVFFNYKK